MNDSRKTNLFLKRLWIYDAATKKENGKYLWAPVVDPDTNRIYYWNKDTDQTQWYFPKNQIYGETTKSTPTFISSFHENSLFLKKKFDQACEHTIVTFSMSS